MHERHGKLFANDYHPPPYEVKLFLVRYTQEDSRQTDIYIYALFTVPDFSKVYFQFSPGKLKLILSSTN